MHQRKWTPFFGILIVLLYGGTKAVAQKQHTEVITLEEIWQKALENNIQIKIQQSNIDIAGKEVKIKRQNLLPSITTNLEVAYLGDIHIYDKDFTNKVKVDMPHLGNSFAIQAQQLIYKGRAVQKGISHANLAHQYSKLQKRNTEQEIKLYVTGLYLDLYRLYNQKFVYQRNIELAQIRLHHTKALHQQELVTQDDVLRTQFMLSKLKIKHHQIENQIQIVNHQLTTAVGITPTVIIYPDTTILSTHITHYDYQTYHDKGVKDNPRLLMSQKKVEIAQNALSLCKSEISPSISLFAVNHLQSPLTTSIPVKDNYANSWKVGLTLSMDLSMGYKIRKRKELKRLQVLLSQEMVVEQEEKIDMEIHSAYLKYKENINELETFKENKLLARENYRMIEKKYVNQLALLIDVLHASNTKLEAELDVANAEINALFSYYKILKITGEL